MTPKCNRCVDGAKLSFSVAKNTRICTYIKAAVVLTTFNNICDACGFLPELSINSFHLRHVDTFFNRPWNLFIVQLIFFYRSGRRWLACYLHITTVHQSNYSSCILVLC